MNEEILRVVEDDGGDAVGFVVATPSSPRNLPLEKAEQLAMKASPFIYTVLVTSTSSLVNIIEASSMVKPHAIQLHSIQSVDDYNNIRRKLPANIRIIGALSIGFPLTSSVQTRKLVQEALTLRKHCDALLLDTPPIGERGGTGEVGNWRMAKTLREALGSYPVILAGGLTSENVAEAIRIVQPYAVDVSSGVESTPGVKDQRKIQRFINNVKKSVRHD